MEQLNLLEISRKTKLDALEKEELIRRYSVLEDELSRVVRELYQLRKIEITDTQLSLVLGEQLEDLRSKIYGSSSEKLKKPENPKKDSNKEDKPSKPRVQKPSERYPNLPVIEKIIAQNPPPSCGLCGSSMKDSGLTDDSEQLTVIPKKYEIDLIKKVIYNCGC